MHPHDAATRLTMERLLLFTDAVFAIILTLLALEIRIPERAALRTSRDVSDTLILMGSQFGWYVLGFSVIALVSLSGVR